MKLFLFTVLLALAVTVAALGATGRIAAPDDVVKASGVSDTTVVIEGPHSCLTFYAEGGDLTFTLYVNGTSNAQTLAAGKSLTICGLASMDSFNISSSPLAHVYIN